CLLEMTKGILKKMSDWRGDFVIDSLIDCTCQPPCTAALTSTGLRGLDWGKGGGVSQW
ncbi:hypothetical protein KUCAC02_002303, partial [Chaenocephalus aceratus]